MTCLYDSLEKDLNSILADIHNNAPLIHCITNPISINDCANAVLALGARPIMAEHPLEVADITKTAKALCLNIGNITDARMDSIMISGKAANQHNIPVIIDIVGITCSNLRYNFINKFLNEIQPTVIKGNLSEIKKLAHIKSSFTGVDSTEQLDTEDEFNSTLLLIKRLAIEMNCIIAASGRTDIISDGKSTVCIDNGSQYMPLITGTGCMLNVIIGTILSSDLSDNLTKTVIGTAILGICGELAEAGNDAYGLERGLGTYHINLINALSLVTPEEIRKRLRIRIF